jgi:hypothetical protein
VRIGYAFYTSQLALLHAQRNDPTRVSTGPRQPPPVLNGALTALFSLLGIGRESWRGACIGKMGGCRFGCSGIKEAQARAASGAGRLGTIPRGDQSVEEGAGPRSRGTGLYPRRLHRQAALLTLSIGPHARPPSFASVATLTESSGWRGLGVLLGDAALDGIVSGAVRMRERWDLLAHSRAGSTLQLLAYTPSPPG